MWELYYMDKNKQWVQVCASQAVEDKNIREFARADQLDHLNEKTYRLYKIVNKDGYDHAIGMARNNGKKGRFKFEWTMVKPTRTIWQCIARGCPGCKVCKEEIK